MYWYSRKKCVKCLTPSHLFSTAAYILKHKNKTLDIDSKIPSIHPVQHLIETNLNIHFSFKRKLVCAFLKRVKVNCSFNSANINQLNFILLRFGCKGTIRKARKGFVWLKFNILATLFTFWGLPMTVFLRCIMCLSFNTF